MTAPPKQPEHDVSQQPGRRIVCAVLLLAGGASLWRFLLEAHLGFNLWDEGYLWYGVQRVLQGEVPIRDFMAYDPGRYYWAAGLLSLFHANGIVAVRAATALFSTLGVVAAAWLVLRGSTGGVLARLGQCAVAVALCLLWMVPWWKGYDAAISIVLAASLARVLAGPSPERFLVHGVVIGLAAVFGRNHGFYGVVACLLATPALMVCANPPTWHRCIPAWLAGVVAGFSPVLLGLALDHQFAAMFWDSVRFLLFEYWGTNLPLPVPWPWTARGDAALSLALFTRWAIGGVFVLLPMFCAIGAAVVVRRFSRERRIGHPEFVACVATALPYLNVAFSRADVSHLAQAIFPLLIRRTDLPYARPWAGDASLAGIAVAGSSLTVGGIAAASLAPGADAGRLARCRGGERQLAHERRLGGLSRHHQGIGASLHARRWHADRGAGLARSVCAIGHQGAGLGNLSAVPAQRQFPAAGNQPAATGSSVAGPCL
jgi:hypothetical protein